MSPDTDNTTADPRTAEPRKERAAAATAEAERARARAGAPEPAPAIPPPSTVAAEEPDRPELYIAAAFAGAFLAARILKKIAE